MLAPFYVEAQALKPCSALAVNLYLKALLKVMDKADGRIRGPRRLILSWIVTEAGAVSCKGALPRPLQHGEVGQLLDELVSAGALKNESSAYELNLLMVHRAPLETV